MIREMFVDMDRQRQYVFVVIIVVANSFFMFNADESEEGMCQPMDSSMGVQDVFITMQTTLKLFKILTNFNLVKFNELVLIVIPTIACHV
jgi:hypothetical protein